MNNAPLVYIPTQPENDGLTLPMLLSLLAHGIVIGLLIYTYQQPTLENVGAIETTMVSPEQLAELQGQIMANRAAAEAADSDSSNPTTEGFDNTTNQNNDSELAPPLSQNTPVFMRSEETAADVSMSQTQQRTQQMQEYRDQVAELAAKIDEEAMDKIKQVQDTKREDISEERERLQEFRNKQNTTTPKINRPSRSDRNIEIETGTSGASSTNKSFDLSDGQATASSSSANASSSRSGASASRGASNSEILGRIKRNYNPPTAAKGSTQRATLTITVNAAGDVTNVSVSGSDSAVNAAAKQAVLDTGNFPIDIGDPKYPTFTVQFSGSN